MLLIRETKVKYYSKEIGAGIKLAEIQEATSNSTDLEPKLEWVETPNENMKNLLLILMAIASLTTAKADQGRYVLQPGAPVATSVEALRQGKVTINSDYKIVYAVKVKEVSPGVLAFTENPNRTGKIYYVEYKYAPEKTGR